MHPWWSVFEEQLFAGIGNGFYNDGAEYDGAWQGGQELEQAEPMNQDDMHMELEYRAHANDPGDLPTQEQLAREAEGPFVGQRVGEETVLLAPQFHTWSPADTPLQDHGEEGIVLHGSLPSGHTEPPPRQETQQHRYITPRQGPATLPAGDTTTTRSSKSKAKGSSITARSKGKKSTTGTSVSSRQHDPIQDWELVCKEPWCGNCYSMPSALKKHMRYHTPKEERPLECRFCLEKFLFKKEVVRHQLTHVTGQFACDLCEHRFNRDDHVVRHKLKVHKIAVPRSMDHTIVELHPLRIVGMQFAQATDMEQDTTLSETDFQQPSDADLDMETPDYGMVAVEEGAAEDYDAYSPVFNQIHMDVLGLVTPPITGHAKTVHAPYYNVFGMPYYPPASPQTPSRPPRQ